MPRLIILVDVAILIFFVWVIVEIVKRLKKKGL